MGVKDGNKIILEWLWSNSITEYVTLSPEQITKIQSVAHPK